MRRRNCHGWVERGGAESEWADSGFGRATAGNCSLALAAYREFAALGARPAESDFARARRIDDTRRRRGRRHRNVFYRPLGHRKRSAMAGAAVLDGLPLLAGFSGAGHGLRAEHGLVSPVALPHAVFRLLPGARDLRHSGYRHRTRAVLAYRIIPGDRLG